MLGTTSLSLILARRETYFPVQVEPLLKLVGHSERSVRESVLKLVKSWSRHVGVTSSVAGVWLTYLNDSDYSLR